jgi:hypothetical protein
MTMAETYDPVFLAKNNVIGLAPNPAVAKTYYKRALDFGNAEAEADYSVCVRYCRLISDVRLSPARCATERRVAVIPSKALGARTAKSNRPSAPENRSLMLRFAR